MSASRSSRGLKTAWRALRCRSAAAIELVFSKASSATRVLGLSLFTSTTGAGMVFDNLASKPEAPVDAPPPSRWSNLLRTRSLGSLRKPVAPSPEAPPVPPVPAQFQLPRDPSLRFANLLSSAQSKDRGGKRMSRTQASSQASSRPVSILSTPTGPLRSALRRQSDESPPRMRAVSWGDKRREGAADDSKANSDSTPSSASLASAS